MSERSSFLQFFDDKKIGQAYVDAADEQEELRAAFLVIVSLMEQTLNEKISVAFARQDLMLLKAYVDSRAKESVKTCREDRFGFFHICERLQLNRAEKVVFYFAVCLHVLSIPKAVWNKLNELRGSETRNAGGAAWFYRTLSGILGEKEIAIEKEKQALLFSGDASHTELGLRRAVFNVMKKGMIEEEAEYVSRRYCRRIMTRDFDQEEMILNGDLLDQLKTLASGNDGDFNICLKGEKGCGKTLLASHLGGYLGRNLMILDGEDLYEMKKETAVYFQPEESREWFYEWLVQVKLSEDLVVLKQLEKADLKLIRKSIQGLILLFEETSFSDWKEENVGKWHLHDTVCFDIPYPDIDEKSKLWEIFLKKYGAGQTLDTMALASKYVLNAGGIREALFAAEAHARGLQKASPDMEDIIWSIRQSQEGGLGKFAKPVTCIFNWDDLIVEEQVKKQMQYICAQIRYRYKVGSEWGFFDKMPYGRGVSALFFGPPGTGKTMAAQVMAKELGYDLYRVDLSQMVSKYIGETEKNISELFERARHMNVILFFDEADALFSKRSEVKDSHDRNANMEVAHLLQQMESYEGIVLLATNLKDNIDDAFKRRIKFMIKFSLPSENIRKELWHKLLPAKTPHEEGLDLDLFAQKFELSGSQIKDVLVSAAFIAAQQDGVLSNEHIKEALYMDYYKNGKILTKNDFGYLG